MSEHDDRYTFPDATNPPSPVQEPSSSLLPAIAAGVVAALVGGIVWGLIAKFSEYEVGIVAWGIGYIAGTAVVLATRGAKGPALQGIAIVSSLVGIVLGKYLGYAFEIQEQADAAGVSIGLFSSDMFTFFREDLEHVFGLFDLLWVGLAVFTAWRLTQPDAPEPAATPAEYRARSGRSRGRSSPGTAGGTPRPARTWSAGTTSVAIGFEKRGLRPRLRLGSGFRLLGRVGEDRGAVLRADVPALAVHLGRVVEAPELVHELAVRDLARIERHLDALGMARAAAADVLVVRVLGLSADVADPGVGDPGRVPELDLDAPEAARREGRGLGRGAHERSSSSAHELMQKRCPVGAGPSGKTWPRCPPHAAHMTSVRTIP